MYLVVVGVGLYENDGGEDGGAEDEDAGECVRRQEVAGAPAEGANVRGGVEQGA